ncbi:primase-like DNA-binding domain-containing protein [Nostoc sp. UHCC 0870]|uniref:primase-like DNA-binding domain-containing protein n=1 Tax=Nostoc sp. UHCC 0870 TaxID=2914041 RepID=UPI001EDD0522|nr:bifunctional DNA primase/polymerase [Nostoc sp. UHCC 0870]UKP01596.1 bifunctional DNA primase/polymerase [Nostoc sp. UHCC 0870]
MNAKNECKLVFDALLNLGFIPLPVAPLQDATKYPSLDKNKNIRRDDKGEIIPKFNGKNPSYLDADGIPHAILHSIYRTKPITEAEREKWFVHPDTGIGCLGTKHNIAIDVDRKNFDSQEECDRLTESWLNATPELKSGWVDRTQSGGYRVLVKVKEPQSFTNFGFGGKQIGEAIGEGRFAVLAPSKGTSANYTSISRADTIPEFDNLEAIGIFKAKSEEELEIPKIPESLNDWMASSTIVRSTAAIATDDDDAETITTVALADLPANDNIDASVEFDEIKKRALSEGMEGIFLIEAISQKNRQRLEGDVEGMDKSKALTTALNDLYGWVNWCGDKNVQFYGNPQEIALIGGAKLGLAPDRVKRIIESIKDTSKCMPACKYKGGDDACQKRVNTLLGIQTPIETDENQVSTSVEDTVLKTLFENGDGNFCVINDGYYKYDDHGVWNHVEDGIIEKWITRKLRELYRLKITKEDVLQEFVYATENNKKNSFKFCRSALSLESIPYNFHLLPFNNGTVDVRTGKLQQHSRDNFLTFKVNADYKENRECPQAFKDFIESSFGSQFLETIRACLSMTLDPTAPFGFAPHLIGASGGGKGTLIRFVGSAFGEKYVASLQSFQELSTPEKRHQNLTGCRLVNFPDLGGFQSGLRSFYELVDNGSLSGRPLFSSNSYSKRWNCRFWLASVDHLQIENSGDGWDRRVIPIPTKRRTCATDPNLEQKLQECKADVISWALAMPRERRDYILLNASKTNDAIAALKKEQATFSDSTRAFIDQCLVPSDSCATTTTGHLYDLYVEYCKANGFSPVNVNRFTSHAKAILPENRVERSKATAGKGTRVNVAAHWRNLESIPQIFTKSEAGIWSCNKNLCNEGGLELFEQFWENGGQIPKTETPEPEPKEAEPTGLQGNQTEIKAVKKTLEANDRNTRLASEVEINTRKIRDNWDDELKIGGIMFDAQMKDAALVSGIKAFFRKHGEEYVSYLDQCQGIYEAKAT